MTIGSVLTYFCMATHGSGKEYSFNEKKEEKKKRKDAGKRCEKMQEKDAKKCCKSLLHFCAKKVLPAVDTFFTSCQLSNAVGLYLVIFYKCCN